MGITATYTTQKMIAQLENFGLRHVSKKLFDLIEQAEREQLLQFEYINGHLGHAFRPAVAMTAANK